MSHIWNYSHEFGDRQKSSWERKKKEEEREKKKKTKKKKKKNEHFVSKQFPLSCGHYAYQFGLPLSRGCIRNNSK